MGSLMQLISTPSIFNMRDSFFQPIEDHFNDVFNAFWNEGSKKKWISTGYPRADVYERGGNYVIEFAVAGCKPEDLSVEVAPDRTVWVRGRMSESCEMKDATYHVKELSRKRFERGFSIPEHLAGDPVASYDNGLLTLTWKLPDVKTVDPQSKQIPISCSGKSLEGKCKDSC